MWFPGHWIKKVWVLATLCLIAVACNSSDSAPPAIVCDGSSNFGSRPQPPLSCNSTTGLDSPLSLCSPTEPCIDAIIFHQGGICTGNVTIPSDVPGCRTTTEHHLFFSPFDDGPPIAWVDANQVTRYTCLKPNGGSSPKPLVIFFHGTGGHASDVYNYTLLRAKAENFDFYGDPNRLGFVLASVQGRNLHWPTIHAPGTHHDYYYRDMGSPSTNQDFAHLDHLIDMLVGDGSVDPMRIYVMGWSNGATFAQFYAIARHTTPTPGGNYVAAAAVYAFANPFASPSSTEPLCEINPYPQSAVPIYLVNRACDSLTACDSNQEAFFRLPPGHSASDWSIQLRDVVGANAIFQIINFEGNAAGSCALIPPCDQEGGALNHLIWPDGILDTGNIDWEIQMLDFLRNNPL